MNRQGTDDLTPPFEQDSEMERSFGISLLVCLAVGDLGANLIVQSLEPPDRLDRPSAWIGLLVSGSARLDQLPDRRPAVAGSGSIRAGRHRALAVKEQPCCAREEHQHDRGEDPKPRRHG